MVWKFLTQSLESHDCYGVTNYRQLDWIFSSLFMLAAKTISKVSSKTFTGSTSEADCLFSCKYISATAESMSESGPHSNEFYPKEGVVTVGVLAVTYFGLKVNGLLSCINRDIFRAFFVYDLGTCFPGRSLDTYHGFAMREVSVNSTSLYETNWLSIKGFSCLFSHRSHIYWFLDEETRCVFPTYWYKNKWISEFCRTNP